MSIVRKEMRTSCYNYIELGEHTMTTLIKVARSINNELKYFKTSKDDFAMLALTIVVHYTMILAMAPIL